MQNDRGEKGFTLVELMVVIFVIGLLATVVLVNVAGDVDQARITKARADIAALETALERYKLRMRHYPDTGHGLRVLIEAPGDGELASIYPEGGFIKRLPDDPWGNPYMYLYPGERGVMDIFSYGADGQPGGDGSDADIGNWRQ